MADVLVVTPLPAYRYTLPPRIGNHGTVGALVSVVANTHQPFFRSWMMTWTKPEFEVVEVTMEITAYVARR
jgi:coenzyme PQQ precursor peptide PqqA